MSTAPTLPLVPIEEYLKSSWRPDMEFVDGVLMERSMPTIAHSLLQIILGEYFRQFEKQFRFKALPEARTEIIERARYRIPDLLLCPKPLPRGKIVNVVPWAVLEILSPEDQLSEMLQRFHDYTTIGVNNVVLLDPEKYIAHRFEAGSLIETAFDSLLLPTGNVPFESSRLFIQMREERNEEE